jgi:pSer/pThr/pTyr-binding forkhead associated (FHA) protein
MEDTKVGTNGAMLIVERGVSEASVVILEDAPHVLGRRPYADTGFSNACLSRRHAEITRAGQRFQIRDLGSRNGTLVNGQTVGPDGHSLSHGDRIELAIEHEQGRCGNATRIEPPTIYER